MILYLLFIFATIFLLVNYSIDNFDILNPAVVFSGMLFLSVVMCIIYQPIYGFKIHAETLFVLMLASSIFTIFNFISINTNKDNQPKKQEFSVIKFNPIVYTAIICSELTTLVFTRNYVSYVAGFFGRTGTYADKLNMYNHISKFTNYLISGKVAGKPSIVTIGEPIALAAAMIFLVILINNYFAKDSLLNLFMELLPIIIYIFIALSRGSRTAVFTILTAFLIAFYTFWHKKNGYNRGRFKFILYILGFAIVIIIGFTFLRTFIGRASSTIAGSIFPYLGGPIVNLDIFLQSHSSIDRSDLFGQETFIYFIRYIGQQTGNSSLIYSTNLPFNSLNGINVGNVYTTFYAWIQDFGYMGIFFLMPILSYWYSDLYSKIKNGKIALFSIKFLMFAYSFNSLIMLLFSNRFYEDLFNPIFFKFVIVAFILKYFLIDDGKKKFLIIK